MSFFCYGDYMEYGGGMLMLLILFEMGCLEMGLVLIVVRVDVFFVVMVVMIVMMVCFDGI